LRLRARVAHALCIAASTEASARLFTMSRAYEASDRSIHGQELDLRKLQQEAITQDMLEVRAGQRRRTSLV
jgi:F0F1-type ATP synthase gamma subunit